MIVANLQNDDYHLVKIYIIMSSDSTSLIKIEEKKAQWMEKILIELKIAVL